MDNRGFFLTWQAVRSHLAAMPNELYLVRLIHNQTGRPFPGERLWTATQLVGAATIRFLRVRNCEGCDVYIQPYAGNQNAGYILVDLDRADPTAVELMRANGHDPCVVVQTSPGHLQAWIRLSSSPLEPAVATAAGRHLAHLYGGDRASTDWRHLGRLAGFTNQKPARRTPDRYAPWVRLVHARAGLAPRGESLLESVRQSIQPPASPFPIDWTTTDPGPASAAEAVTIYRSVCSDGIFANASRSRIGASWIFGSPDTCSRRASPLFRFKPSSGSPVRIFPAATVIPMTTCDAPSHAQRFPPQGALCARS